MPVSDSGLPILPGLVLLRWFFVGRILGRRKIGRAIFLQSTCRCHKLSAHFPFLRPVHTGRRSDTCVLPANQCLHRLVCVAVAFGGPEQSSRNCYIILLPLSVCHPLPVSALVSLFGLYRRGWFGQISRHTCPACSWKCGFLLPVLSVVGLFLLA